MFLVKKICDKQKLEYPPSPPKKIQYEDAIVLSYFFTNTQMAPRHLTEN